MDKQFVVILAVGMFNYFLGYVTGRFSKRRTIIQDPNAFDNGFQKGFVDGKGHGVEVGRVEGEKAARHKLSNDLIEWMEDGIRTLRGEDNGFTI